MIESIFEKWLNNISKKMASGGAINIAEDKVPFGVETVDDLERERQLQIKQRNKRKIALRNAIKDGRICFLMYGGIKVKGDMLSQFDEEHRLRIGDDKGRRRLKRLIKSALSNDPQEGDYAFVSVPAYVKLVPPAECMQVASEEIEKVSADESLADNEMVQQVLAEAKASLRDYEIELDTDYLEALTGDALSEFIHANKDDIKEMDGCLFGGEDVLTYVESMLGSDLVVIGDDGKSYQRDCFAYTLTRVAERLRYL